MDQKKVLFSIFFLLISFSYFGQSRNAEADSVEMTGMIFNDTDPIREATINIFDENDLIKVVKVKRSNRFRINLPIDKSLTVEIAAPEFHTKRFIFDTNLPDDAKKIPDFDFDMDIFSREEMANVNTSLLDFPIGMVSYHEKKKKFLRNVEYTKKMKARYMKLLEESIMSDRATE